MSRVFGTSLACVMLASWCVWLAGCSSAPEQGAGANGGRDGGGGGSGAGGVRVSGAGLEMRVWVVDNTPRVVPLALSPNALRRYQQQERPTATVEGPGWGAALRNYEGRAVALSQVTQDLWRANGVRVFSVPVRELDGLRDSLRMAGARQERWLGQTPVWTEVIRGPQLASLDAIMMDSGALRVEGGNLRLLLRAWLVPAGAGALGGSGLSGSAEVMGPEPLIVEDGMARAALQVEILPQHYVPARGVGGMGAADVFSAGPARVPRAEEEGLVFERLALRAMLMEESDALVIVPEVLGVEDEGDKGGEGVSGVGVGVGPVPPRGLMFGEALLTDTPGRGAASAVVMLVLVPRVPQRYSLLEGSAGVAK
jgi:hypothetical protein